MINSHKELVAEIKIFADKMELIKDFRYLKDTEKIIDEVNALRDNSLDYYASVRSAYYQNRKAAIINDNDNTSMPLPLISIEFE